MLVSVIMPTYNCGNLISNAVKSVIAQTVSDWELIIIDDCSTDNTKEVLRPFLEIYDSIILHSLSKNCGPAAARNKGLSRAKGQYIAFLDSDDVWLPKKLEIQIAFMINHGVYFSCTSYEQKAYRRMKPNLICVPPHKTDYFKMLCLSNPIGNSTVMYDQIALKRYLVPLIKKRNDFALWLKILHDIPFCAGLDEVLTIYHIRECSVSSRKLTQLKYHWQLYFKIEKLGMMNSIIYIICWAFVKGTGIGLVRKKTTNTYSMDEF